MAVSFVLGCMRAAWRCAIVPNQLFLWGVNINNKRLTLSLLAAALGSIVTGCANPPGENSAQNSDTAGESKPSGASRRSSPSTASSTERSPQRKGYLFLQKCKVGHKYTEEGRFKRTDATETPMVLSLTSATELISIKNDKYTWKTIYTTKAEDMGAHHFPTGKGLDENRVVLATGFVA